MVRIVLYAEGVGETGVDPLPPAPGRRLDESRLGPAHVLIRRTLTGFANLDASGVIFEAPLRLSDRNGHRIARGSDLHNRSSLRRLLSWADPRLEPDLAVVLVDCDGQRGRRRELERFIEEPPTITVKRVVAMAIQEFESWLIADYSAVAELLGKAISAPPSPEGLEPAAAKNQLREWIKTTDQVEHDVRLQIARTCDLVRLQRACSSFEDFKRDLVRSLESQL